MSTRSHCVLTGAGALAGAAVLTLFGFGPLDPPNGPITGTYKTLTEVEPRTPIQSLAGNGTSVAVINAPGSYYLTGDLVVPDGKCGIRIASGGTRITIDLNGFAIVAQNLASLEGIRVDAPTTAITVRNGRIRGGTTGLDAANAEDCTIDHVAVDNTSAEGIRVGAGSSVTDCTVRLCGTNGINTAAQCIVVRCIARTCGAIGIDVDDDSVVRDSIATGNTTDGISTNHGCTVAGCTTSSNVGNGVNTQDSCIIADSIGRSNGGVGLDVDGAGVIRDCAAADNTGDGVTANNGCVVSGCAAVTNATGVTAGSVTSVSGCTAYNNSTHGVAFGSSSHVWFNNASGNGTGGGSPAGFFTAGNLSFVDQNICRNNPFGFRLDGAENEVVRNAVSDGVLGAGNDHYDRPGLDAWMNVY